MEKCINCGDSKALIELPTEDLICRKCFNKIFKTEEQKLYVAG